METVEDYSSRCCILITVCIRNAFNLANHTLVIGKFKQRKFSSYLIKYRSVGSSTVAVEQTKWTRTHKMVLAPEKTEAVIVKGGRKRGYVTFKLEGVSAVSPNPYYIWNRIETPDLN